jgi:hypothetical protein
MSIPVSQPGYTVTLRKLVTHTSTAAEPYQAGQRTIELTPLLGGDGGLIQTEKKIFDDGKSQGGAFKLVLPDRQEPGAGDTLLRVVEPMDLVEIRAARHPHRYAGGALPLLMRGFVTTINRSEKIAAEGKGPVRIITIEGHDSEKLLRLYTIIFNSWFVGGKSYLTAADFWKDAGFAATLTPVSEFVRTVVEKAVNPNIAAMGAFAQRSIAPFRVEATVADGAIVTAMSHIQGWQGSLWDMLVKHADRPWNELFVRDEESGPVIVFRPAPYKDLSGRLIRQGAADPGTLEASAKEVIELAMGRGDGRVANLFAVNPDAVLECNGALSFQNFKQDAYQADHGNNKPDLFGLRAFDPKGLTIAQYSERNTGIPAAMTGAPAARAAEIDTLKVWFSQRISDLKAFNQDNVVFEEGSATMVGDEAYQIGKMLRLRRGDLTWEGYIQSVTHAISPLSGWTTTLGLVRGTGFIARLAYGGAPAIAEGRPGVYA